MQFWKILWVLLISLTLHATADNHYLLTNRDGTKTDFFVKAGAFRILSHAREALAATDLPLHIMRIKTFYCLVSKRFASQQEAQSHLHKIQNTYPDAYIITLYRKPAPKTQTGPDPLTRNMQQGIAAFKAKRYEEALAAFDRQLIEQPENTHAQRYYAKSLYALRLFKEAREAFVKLSKSDLSKSEQAEVAKYLEAIEKSRQKHIFSLTLTAGVGYDDNINLNPDRNTTQYGPYTLRNDTDKTASSYGIFACTLAHTYKAENFTLYSQLYSYNELLHSAKGNDLNFLDVSTALIKQYKNLTLLFPIGLNTAYLDGEHISQNLYTIPTIRMQAAPMWQTSLHATLLENHTTFAKDRDYRRYGSGIGVRYGTSRDYAGIDLCWQRDDAKTQRRYDINQDVMRYTLYGYYHFRKLFYLGANADWERHRYRDLDPVMGYRRHDDKKRFRVTLGKAVTPASALEGSYVYTDNDANINTFSYEKNALTLKYRYQY